MYTIWCLVMWYGCRNFFSDLCDRNTEIFSTNKIWISHPIFLDPAWILFCSPYPRVICWSSSYKPKLGRTNLYPSGMYPCTRGRVGTLHRQKTCPVLVMWISSFGKWYVDSRGVDLCCVFCFRGLGERWPHQVAVDLQEVKAPLATGCCARLYYMFTFRFWIILRILSLAVRLFVQNNHNKKPAKCRK